MTQAINPKFINTFQEAFHEGDQNAANKLEEEKNVRQLEDVFRLVAGRDYGKLSEILAEDVIFEIIGSPNTPMAGITRGRQQVIETIENNFAQIDEQQPEIQSVVAQGNTVVVVGRDQGRFRPTGQTYELHWMHQYTFKEGKIIHIRELFDSASLLNVNQA